MPKVLPVPPGLEGLRDNLANHLTCIEGLFRESAKPKVTLVVRMDGLEDADIVIGNDDFDRAAETIRSFQRRTEPKAGA
jgi:hypothetical protein